MSVELIKYAFISGELSPKLFGRTDLTKYDLGLALARNWFVDYRGGISTRPGTEFCDYIKFDELETKFFEFRFSPSVENTYVLLFGHQYVRFIQDGAYVLETEKSITDVTQANPGVVTSVAHGYATGDWVRIYDVGGMGYINGRTFSVVVLDANTFSLVDPGSLLTVDTTGWPAYTSGGKVAKVYEKATPYSSADLADLSSEQNRDLVRITHPMYQTRNLTRNNHTDWVLAAEITNNNVPRPNTPGGVASTPVGTSRSSVVYAVSAVLKDGTEGPISIPLAMKDIVSFTTEAGTVRLNWAAVAGAVRYKIYRSSVAATGGTGTIGPSAGARLGFLGETTGTEFVDTNIIPDFTITPVEVYDPFAQGAIDTITVTAPGSGYSFAPSITVTGGTGSGFRGFGVTDAAGLITGVVIQDGGSGYTSSLTISFSGGGGSGATATGTIRSEAPENPYPSISSLFQQRQAYAASLSEPLRLWGSQIKRYNNFTDALGTDSGAYEFDIDSAQVSPIRHMLPMRGGLLLMSQIGIWLLTGTPQGGPVTPTNALADPQDYTGVSKVKPLKVGTDLLYIEGKGYSIRQLAYNEFSKVYSGEDRSILSNHLFGPTKQIVRWAFADNPYKLVYGVRSDGAIVMFTIVKEQDVFAWTWGQTKGLFKDILSITEGDYDSVYVTVVRLINGRWRKYFERFAPREFADIENAWAVDAGAKLSPPVINTALTVSPEFTVGDSNYVTLTTVAGVFTDTVGQIVRAGGGIFEITTVVTQYVANAVVHRSMTSVLPEDDTKLPLPISANDWSMGPKVTKVAGFHHLIGEKISLLGDGSVMPPVFVDVNGEITLQDGVTKLIGGVQFRAVAQTLPPVVNDVTIEAKRKRVMSVAVRLNESRGLQAGRTLDELYPMRERTNESMGQPIRTINGFKHVLLSTDWDEAAQAFFVQEDPLPATILGLVPNLDIGDDND